MPGILVQGKGSLVKGMGLEPVRADYAHSGGPMSLSCGQQYGFGPIMRRNRERAGTGHIMTADLQTDCIGSVT
ncbi:hypothetical protein ASZ90_016247 [hydrocarbon metagenome]|uniref:Uncharacterized protein n=1 Tax=hydrocarbon metagenome TaxID=938273 RepID=A0A0W8EZQ3_9ZZZZ